MDPWLAAWWGSVRISWAACFPVTAITRCSVCPPILYGICGGLFRYYLGKGVTVPRLAVSFLPPVIFGSILWQSFALAFVYNSKGSFGASMIYFLSTRSIQFAVTLVLDVLIIYLLFRVNLFSRMGIWPPVKKS